MNKTKKGQREGEGTYWRNIDPPTCLDQLTLPSFPISLYVCLKLCLSLRHAIDLPFRCVRPLSTETESEDVVCGNH